ncbi:MAG TPA: CusA/CzcA family heavy metal efflux RND transporter [Burkholderiales bacterium]|nr:CusA/CzcA family heavy metal efflux RND transporter [Burkholderiales bacterium]
MSQRQRTTVIGRVVAFALQQPLFIFLGMVLFIGGGIAAFKQLPVEALPDVTDTQVTVISLYPGRAAEEVEKQVTFPIEVALAGMPNSIRMFSHTQFGLSFIILTFDDKANAYFARQQVLERLREADLPPGVSPQLAPMSTAVGEIYRYRVKGAGVAEHELRTIQDWTVSRQLRLIPGVADIVSFGGFIKQYEVNPDLAKLKYYKISLQQLFSALERGSSNAGGGYVEQGRQQFLIRGIGLVRSPEEVLDIVVAERNGVPVLVRHIAGLSIGSVPRQGVIGQDGDPDIVTGVVLMRKGENPAVVLEAVKQKVALLNNSVLPKGVSVVPYYDRTWLLDKTLKTVFSNLVEGATLVTLVLVLFLGNFRAAAIVASIIPLSLLGTFLGLTFLGVPANLLSLGAMDFGIIVDGAVIVVENVFRRLGERHHAPDDNRGRMQTILEAATEVGRPTLFSMLIIIAAHIPIFTLQRHEGRIFAPMAYSVTSALIASLIFSLTLVPLLCYVLLRKNVAHEENRLVQRCKKIYRPALEWSLRHRRIVVGAAIGAFALSLAAVPHLGTEFLPELNEGSIWINVPLHPSLSVTEAREEMSRIRGAIKDIPEVNTIVYKAGRPEDGTDPKLISMAEILVDLKPENEWKRKVTKQDIIREMDKAFEKLPGMQASFSQPIRDNILESISQIDGQIVVKIFGDDLVVLRDTGQAVLGAISDVPGLARAMIDRQGELPQELIEIDRAQAARYGLNIGDIQDVIETALGGREAIRIWEGERKFGVVVRLREDQRSLTQLRDILLTTQSGAFIPLAQVASFKTIGGSMNISRENGGRVIAIGVFIEGRDMGSVVADMQARVAQKVKLPAGYTMSWSGEFENQERAMKRLSVIVPISILLIFILLFDAFKSFRGAALILLNIPLALIGGIVALLVTGIPLSVSAAIGFIALFGQAVLNGVVMVSYFNQLKSEGRSPEEAVIEGSLVRLRTVLMTGLLAMFGLLPMALSHDIGSETQKPLAIVVIGGLISATILTLIVLPTLYVIFERRYYHGHGQSRAPAAPAAAADPDKL